MDQQRKNFFVPFLWMQMSKWQEVFCFVEMEFKFGILEEKRQQKRAITHDPMTLGKSNSGQRANWIGKYGGPHERPQK